MSAESIRAMHLEAAEDLIRILEAEVARLTRERDEYLDKLRVAEEQGAAWKMRCATAYDAEVERLREEIEMLRSALRFIATGGPTDVVGCVRSARLALEGRYDSASEVERLREALRGVMDNLGVPGEGYPSPVAVAYEIARAALEGGGR